MSRITLLAALCLPELDVEALGQGRMISAALYAFVRPEQCFALLPATSLLSPLSIEDHYCDTYRPTAQDYALRKSNLLSESEILNYWAKCTSCKVLQKGDALDDIALLTVWSSEALKELINRQEQIFIATLRVYQAKDIPSPVDKKIVNERVGRAIPLPEKIVVENYLPVLSEQKFARRSQQLKTIQPPTHKELEKLEASLFQDLQDNFSAQVLRHEIFSHLGWRSTPPVSLTQEELAWIYTIASLGHRSKEEENQAKSNYQAGTDFEIVVRNSLEYLGFTVDYAHRGGAGGLDLSCSKPYVLVGECKSGRKIPNDTAVQLLNLGTLRLSDKKTYREAVKLIIGPGEPTTQLEKAAIVHGMSTINPATLENLVRLHHQYPGSIDLFQLKDYLADGRADDEVDKYIHKVREQILLRAQIVQQVKHYLEDAKAEDANVDYLHAIYITSKPKYALSRQEFYEILVELASPLAGYLGRRRAEDGSDRFYFLRDLHV